jgi:hypothetical protein
LSFTIFITSATVLAIKISWRGGSCKKNLVAD